MDTINSNSYIPPYVAPNLKWYERDGLLTYIDRLKYERKYENRDSYLENVEITNFDIIHHECRGDPLQKSHKEYMTVNEQSVDRMSTTDRKKAMGACFRTKRKDLYVQRNLMLSYFKTL